MFQLHPDKQSHGLSVGTWYTKNHSAIFFFANFDDFGYTRSPAIVFFFSPKRAAPISARAGAHLIFPRLLSRGALLP